MVPHRSTEQAQWCLTSEFGWDPVVSPWYERTMSDGEIYDQIVGFEPWRQQKVDTPTANRQAEPDNHQRLTRYRAIQRVLQENTPSYNSKQVKR